jgi:hypothetical protein
MAPVMELCLDTLEEIHALVDQSSQLLPVLRYHVAVGLLCVNQPKKYNRSGEHTD